MKVEQVDILSPSTMIQSTHRSGGVTSLWGLIIPSVGAQCSDDGYCVGWTCWPAGRNALRVTCMSEIAPEIYVPIGGWSFPFVRTPAVWKLLYTTTPCPAEFWLTGDLIYRVTRMERFLFPASMGEKPNFQLLLKFSREWIEAFEYWRGRYGVGEIGMLWRNLIFKLFADASSRRWILWKIWRWIGKALVEGALNWESKKIWKYWIHFMCVFIFSPSFCNFRDVDLTLFNLSALLNCIYSCVLKVKEIFHIHFENIN